MINSIQQFQMDGVKNLTNIFSKYTDDLSKTAEMIYGVTDEIHKLGRNLIKEEWESYDELLCKRKANGKIRKDRKKKKQEEAESRVTVEEIEGEAIDKLSE